MVLFDPHRYAYPSRRSVVYARRAMACTSVPLGAQVGLDVMKAGGNAVDAAVAMAAAMPLLEPTGNGLGRRLLRPGLGGEGEEAVRTERQRRGSHARWMPKMVREPWGFGEMPKDGLAAHHGAGGPRGLGGDQPALWRPSPCPSCLLPPSPMPGREYPVPVNLEPQWAEGLPAYLPRPGARNRRPTPIGGIRL